MDVGLAFGIADCTHSESVLVRYFGWRHDLLDRGDYLSVCHLAGKERHRPPEALTKVVTN
jgi:hypothetical protein